MLGRSHVALCVVWYATVLVAISARCRLRASERPHLSFPYVYQGLRGVRQESSSLLIREALQAFGCRGLAHGNGAKVCRAAPAPVQRKATQMRPKVVQVDDRMLGHASSAFETSVLSRTGGACTVCRCALWTVSRGGHRCPDVHRCTVVSRRDWAAQAA